MPVEAVLIEGDATNGGYQNSWTTGTDLRCPFLAIFVGGHLMRVIRGSTHCPTLHHTLLWECESMRRDKFTNVTKRITQTRGAISSGTVTISNPPKLHEFAVPQSSERTAR